MRPPGATIDQLVIGDDPDVWRDVGFTIDRDGTCRIGTVRVRLVGREGGEGFRSWSLRDIETVDDIDGMATTVSTEPPAEPGRHLCGATHIDHLVWLTPDGQRTADAVTAATGAEVRRVRDTEMRDRPIKQRFIRFGEVILEVVSSEPASTGPVRFFGIAVTVEDLDMLVARSGATLSEIREAVQPGRRVATLNMAASGLSVPLLFITPDP